jgi:predicted nucleotidyltransferase component of viral defense system
VIQSSNQLKSLVRNRSNGDSTKAQIIFRNYIMERFLERVSLSSYRDNIIIKGGVLIASIVGIDKRSTMDIDLTLKSWELSENSIQDLLEQIFSIEMNDNVKFNILDISTIMEDFDYPGIRVSLITEIDRMRIPLKLDFSTGDVITPKEIEYHYSLMFENRTISILAYNTETTLSEKFETIISRGTANSRMRDYYDIYMLQSIGLPFKKQKFLQALKNTSQKRKSSSLMKEWKHILDEIHTDTTMQLLWRSYQKKYDYATNISWNKVIVSVEILGNIIEEEIETS